MCCFNLTACSPETEECTHASKGWDIVKEPTETTKGKYCDFCCYCGNVIETKEIELIQINAENLEQYYTLDIEVLDSGRSVTLSEKSDLTIIKSFLKVSITIYLSGVYSVIVMANWTETVCLNLVDNNTVSQDFNNRWKYCYDVKLVNNEVTMIIDSYCWLIAT